MTSTQGAIIWEAGGFWATKATATAPFYLWFDGPRHGRGAVVVDPDDKFGSVGGLTPGEACALIRYTLRREGREDIEIEGVISSFRAVAWPVGPVVEATVRTTSSMAVEWSARCPLCRDLTAFGFYAQARRGVDAARRIVHKCAHVASWDFDTEEGQYAVTFEEGASRSPDVSEARGGPRRVPGAVDARRELVTMGGI